MITVIFLGILCTVAVLLLVRIQIFCGIRIRMIDEDFEGSYRRLPSYDAMVLKHWSKWTYRQWKRWADDRGAK